MLFVMLPFPNMSPGEEFEYDELFRLEQMIARRADELSRQFGVNRGHVLEHWRQAEREVLELDSPEFASEPEMLPR